MLITQSLGYLLKSYCRESSFSVKEVAKISGLKESALRKWLDKNFLPEASEVLAFSKALKIPKVLVWEAYFNSVQLWDHKEPKYRLTSYSEKEALIKFNKTQRKQFNHKSLPWDEAYEIFGKDSLNHLSLGSLLSIDGDRGADKTLSAKEQSKKYKIPEERVKTIRKGAIPTVKELDKLISGVDMYDAQARLKGFAAQVIKKYKLNLYLSEEWTTADLNLLDRITK